MVNEKEELITCY